MCHVSHFVFLFKEILCLISSPSQPPQCFIYAAARWSAGGLKAGFHPPPVPSGMETTHLTLECHCSCHLLTWGLSQNWDKSPILIPRACLILSGDCAPGSRNSDILILIAFSPLIWFLVVPCSREIAVTTIQQREGAWKRKRQKSSVWGWCLKGEALEVLF